MARSSGNEVLHGDKDERNVLRTIERRKANYIGHISRRNCLLKHVIERKVKARIKVVGRRGRRRSQLLDDLNLLATDFFFQILAHPIFKM